MNSPFRKLSSLLLLVPLLITACVPPRARTSDAAEKRAAEATVAAIFVQTEMARPTSTITPLPTLPPTETQPPPTATPQNTATPAAAVIRATPRGGLELYASPDIPEYVFQIDPAKWEKDPSGQTSNLVHKRLTGCRVEPGSAEKLAQPNRLLWTDLGRFRWEILDYGGYALVTPVAGGGLGSQGNRYLKLQGYNATACRGDHLKILSNLMSKAEAQGDIRTAAFASPTPRGALEGASCPNTPPARVRVGDYIAVTADALWMRSEPRADESTKTRKFARYAPYQIRVTGGPVCEKYLYWQVEAFEVGKTTAFAQGWLAEGDPNEYYIAPVK